MEAVVPVVEHVAVDQRAAGRRIQNLAGDFVIRRAELAHMEY
jgi:hypothetical protein